MKAQKPALKDTIVLREEADNYALLYSPDTGGTYVINPVGVFICRMLDGTHTVTKIAEAVIKNFADVPDRAKEDIREFINALLNAGFLCDCAG